MHAWVPLHCSLAEAYTPLFWLAWLKICCRGSQSGNRSKGSPWGYAIHYSMRSRSCWTCLHRSTLGSHLLRSQLSAALIPRPYSLFSNRPIPQSPPQLQMRSTIRNNLGPLLLTPLRSLSSQVRLGKRCLVLEYLLRVVMNLGDSDHCWFQLA